MFKIKKSNSNIQLLKYRYNSEKQVQWIQETEIVLLIVNFKYVVR